MDISVIGASGDCGREIVIQLVRDAVLEPHHILQLVGGHEGSERPMVCDGLRADLEDAYAEVVPELDVTHDPGQVIGDVVVMAAGKTIPTDLHDLREFSRDELARYNATIFERYAQGLASARGRMPFVIIVSNPVELGVHVFSRHIGRQNVVGMGAYSDSLRFRWEIAHDLGIRRQMVSAAVAGEHGDGMVPLWSSVRVFGMERAERVARLSRIRRDSGLREFPERLRLMKQTILETLINDPVRGQAEAFARVNAEPPDIRVALKPFLIHLTGAKTAVATARTAVDLIKSLIEGRRMHVAAQFEMDGEVLDLHVPFGIPLIISWTGAEVVPFRGYTDEEAELISVSADAIREKIEAWTHGGRSEA